jgi:hypothetical protein
MVMITKWRSAYHRIHNDLGLDFAFDSDFEQQHELCRSLKSSDFLDAKMKRPLAELEV